MSLENVVLHLVEGREDLRKFYKWLDSGPLEHGIMAVDTESTGLSKVTDKVRLVQVGDREHGWAIPWVGWSGLFEEAIEAHQGTYLMHNAPFDFPMLRNMGVTMDHTRIKDTMTMVKIVEPHKSAALKYACGRLVDPAASSAQDELAAAIKKFGWAGVPIKFPPYWQYGALDPVLTAWLYHVLLPRIEEQGAHEAVDVETSVLWVLDRMMTNGVPVNVDLAREQAAKFAQYSKTAADWCQQEYGVSPGSNVGVIERLQRDGLEFDKLTAGGAYSLDKEVLEGIDHPLARTVLKRRQYDKLNSTYLKYYIEHNQDGMIFPSINSMGARTGRMSVSQPNFQNLPRASEENKAASAIRDCIEAWLDQDQILVFCDFSQIETRLLAHLSGDQGLIDAFHLPEDFFVTLARRVFNDSGITKKDPRRNAIKTWVYAKIYGAGLEKMAKTLGISMAEMASFDESISNAFPGIRRFQREVQNAAHIALRDTGIPSYRCPLSGRLHVADKGKEYALVNYLIQGMAAFFFKRKLLELDAAGLGPYMILPVHDEIILHIPREKAPWAVEILTEVMNDNTTFRVPIAAEVSFGQRWGQKMDWKEWVDEHAAVSEDSPTQGDPDGEGSTRAEGCEEAVGVAEEAASHA